MPIGFFWAYHEFISEFGLKYFGHVFFVFISLYFIQFHAWYFCIWHWQPLIDITILVIASYYVEFDDFDSTSILY